MEALGSGRAEGGSIRIRGAGGGSIITMRGGGASNYWDTGDLQYKWHGPKVP